MSNPPLEFIETHGRLHPSEPVMGATEFGFLDAYINNTPQTIPDDNVPHVIVLDTVWKVVGTQWTLDPVTGFILPTSTGPFWWAIVLDWEVDANAEVGTRTPFLLGLDGVAGMSLSGAIGRPTAGNSDALQTVSGIGFISDTSIPLKLGAMQNSGGNLDIEGAELMLGKFA